MKLSLVFGFLLTTVSNLFAQTDSTCWLNPYNEVCLNKSEKLLLKKLPGIALRNKDSLILKCTPKPVLFINKSFRSAPSEIDSSVKFYLVEYKSDFFTILRSSPADGESWILVGKKNNYRKELETKPVYSPSGKKIMVVSGRFHKLYSNEALVVYKLIQNRWIEEYRSDPKATEAYGKAKWTGENRIITQKYDWENPAQDGQPGQSETIFIFEYNEWRRISKK